VVVPEPTEPVREIPIGDYCVSCGIRLARKVFLWDLCRQHYAIAKKRYARVLGLCRLVNKGDYMKTVNMDSALLYRIRDYPCSKKMR